MIRHVVMFRWTPEATQEQKQRVTAELSRLPALLPVLRAYHMGADLGINEGSFDWAAVAPGSAEEMVGDGVLLLAEIAQQNLPGA